MTSATSLPKKSDTNSVNRVPTLDLIEARLAAQEIAEEDPRDWKVLAKTGIERRLSQGEGCNDPSFQDIEHARQYAAAMPNHPDERIEYANTIVELLTKVIAARSQQSHAVGKG